MVTTSTPYTLNQSRITGCSTGQSMNHLHHRGDEMCHVFSSCVCPADSYRVSCVMCSAAECALLTVYRVPCVMGSAAACALLTVYRVLCVMCSAAACALLTVYRVLCVMCSAVACALLTVTQSLHEIFHK